jgi:hypothetical protein
MHASVIKKLKDSISDLKDTIKLTEEMLDAIKHINVGSLVYVEYSLINTVRSGVEAWLTSCKPALLRYRYWTLCDAGIALNCDVLASQEKGPYEPPNNPQYSGLIAQIREPNRLSCEGFKANIVTVKELPLYVGYAHTTSLFSKLLKGKL